jgi:hypothetical protein
VLKESSNLDPHLVVEREERLATIDSPFGPLEAFGVVDAAETFTSFTANEGKLFYVSGEVVSQRGLGELDAQVLGLRYGDGARFEIARKIDPALPRFTLTIFSTNLEVTKTFQRHHRNGAHVCAAVRVVVAHRNAKDRTVRLTEFGGNPAPTVASLCEGAYWPGFEPIAVKPKDGRSQQKAHPWGLIVEAILPLSPEHEK